MLGADSPSARTTSVYNLNGSLRSFSLSLFPLPVFDKLSGQPRTHTTPSLPLATYSLSWGGESFLVDGNDRCEECGDKVAVSLGVYRVKHVIGGGKSRSSTMCGAPAHGAHRRSPD
jgi:hypothetical protein